MSDYDLIVNGEDQTYCEKQCLKYCYYISQVWGIEVLQLKAEFLKDENGFIWLFYVRDIFTRTKKNKNLMTS